MICSLNHTSQVTHSVTSREVRVDIKGTLAGADNKAMPWFEFQKNKLKCKA